MTTPALPEFSLLKLLRAIALLFVVTFAVLMGSFYALVATQAEVRDAAAPSYPPPLGTPHDAGAEQSDNWYAVGTVTAERGACSANPYSIASCNSSPPSRL